MSDSSSPIDVRLLSKSVGRDRVLKAITKDRQAVVVAVDARRLLAESLTRVKAWPPSMIHLGQGLLGAALLQGLPDHVEDDKIELQWRVSGPFGHLFAECRGRTQLRGTILYPQADVADLKHGLGEGILQVRRYRKTASTGIVEAKAGVALDLLEYLEKSEQKNCAMNVWVDLAWNESLPKDKPFEIRHAMGYLVHVLPQKTKKQNDAMLLNWDRHLNSLGTLSQWVMGEDPASDILSFVTAEFKPEVLSDETPEFFCSCSAERAERALALAERADADMLAAGEKHGATEEVQCEYCGRIYHVTDHAGVKITK